MTVSNSNLFDQRLIQFIGELCQKTGTDISVGLDTKLFENKLINSIRILDIMAFVETELEISIDDDKMSMEYFQTPRKIVETFISH